jgi:hypothetical protein
MQKIKFLHCRSQLPVFVQLTVDNTCCKNDQHEPSWYVFQKNSGLDSGVSIKWYDVPNFYPKLKRLQDIYRSPLISLIKFTWGTIRASLCGEVLLPKHLSCSSTWHCTSFSFRPHHPLSNWWICFRSHGIGKHLTVIFEPLIHLSWPGIFLQWWLAWSRSQDIFANWCDVRW